MQRLQLKSHLSTAEISQKLAGSSSVRIAGYWQIILSLSFNPGRKAEEYAMFLGKTKSQVYKIVELYNKHGAGFVDRLRWGGRREQISYLSLEREAGFINSLSERASKGEILTAKHIKKEVESTVGHRVSDDYIWDLFKRHEWKKKMPRPEHPKKDQQAQDAFKKNSLKYWHPKQ